MTRLVAAPANQGHVFPARFDGSVDQTTFTIGGNSSFARMSQVDFDGSTVAQFHFRNPIGQNLNLFLANFPIAFAPENTLKSLGQFGSYSMATRLWRLFLVAATNELDVIR
jgi:hypothetical protein